MEPGSDRRVFQPIAKEVEVASLKVRHMHLQPQRFIALVAVLAPPV